MDIWHEIGNARSIILLYSVDRSNATETLDDDDVITLQHEYQFAVTISKHNIAGVNKILWYVTTTREVNLLTGCGMLDYYVANPSTPL